MGIEAFQNMCGEKCPDLSLQTEIFCNQVKGHDGYHTADTDEKENARSIAWAQDFEVSK